MEMRGFAALAAAAMLGLWLAAVPVGVAAADGIDPFIQEDGIRNVRISPTGEYLAMTMRVDGQTGLMIVPRGDTRPQAVMRFWRGTHVHDFAWVNDERVLMSLAETFGTRDDPVLTGELYGMNADGGRKERLVGYRGRRSTDRDAHPRGQGGQGLCFPGRHAARR